MASFLCDHNVIRDLVSELRRRGHAALTAQEVQLDRASDREILTLAGAQGLTLISGDRDFVDLHHAGIVAHAGIPLIRPLPVPRPQDRGRAMADAIETLLATNPRLPGCLHRYTPAGWTSACDE